MRFAFPHRLFHLSDARIIIGVAATGVIFSALSHGGHSSGVGHLIPQLPFIFAAIPVFIAAIFLGEPTSFDAVIPENDLIEQVARAVPDILYVYDVNDRRVVYINQQVLPVLGYKEWELTNLGEAFLETLVHPEDFSKYSKWLAKCDGLEKREVLEHEYRVRHSNGEWRWLHSREVVFKRSRSGAVTQILASAHDITDRKLIEEELLESKQRTASILKALPDLMFIMDGDGTYLDYYASDPRQLFVPPEAFLGKNMREILPAHLIDGIVECFDRAKRSDEPQRSEYSLEIDGVESMFEYRVVRSGQSKFLAIVRNITEQKRTALALAKTEYFNKSIIESSNDCIKILDLDGKLLYINPRGLELLELEDDSCIGGLWLDFWDQLDRADLRIEIAKARAGQIGRFQGFNPTARGTKKWWDVQISPITDAESKVERLLVISRDITDQKVSAEKLLKKERFFRSLIENTHDIVDVLRLDGTIVYESPSVEAVLGYSPDERIGKNCLDYIHPDDKPRVADRFMDAVHSHHKQAVEYRYQHKSGGYVHLEVIGRLSTDENGEPIVIVNKRDISERKAMEAKLRTSDDLYRNVVESQSELICRFLPDSTLTFVNEACCRFFGRSREQLIGTKVVDLIPENRRDESIENLKLLFANRGHRSVEREVIQPNGNIAWTLWTNHPMFDEKENVVEIQSVGRDVTEHKAMEAKLRISEDLYRNVVETQTELICRFLPDSTLTFVNEAYCRFFGHSREDLIGTRFIELIPEEAHDATIEVLSKLVRDHESTFNEHEVRLADGSIGWQQWMDHAILDAEGNVVELLGVGRDVTEQKRFEKALLESEEKYRRIVDTMLEGVWIVDADMRIIFANHQLADMLGYSVEELIGEPGHNFFDDKTVGESREIKEKRKKGISEHYDAKLRRKDGSHLWALISAAPIHNEDGEFLGSLAMLTDITERKRDEADLREAEERIRIASDAANIYTWEIEVPTGKISLSSNVERVLGFELPADIAQITQIFHADDRESLIREFRKSMEGNLQQGFVDYRLVNPKTSEIVWIRSKGVSIKETKNRPARVIGIAQNVTAVKLAEEQLQQLAARLLTLQDEERRRLARELHDETAQNLAALDLTLSSVKKMLLPDQKKALSLIEQGEFLNQRSLREVRTISYVLHPPSLDERGLVSAIRWMIEGFSTRSGIAVDLVENTDIGRLPEDIEIALYRIVQEGLTNIHRHSGSERATISLTREIDRIILVVKDDGCGLPKEALDSSGDGPQSLGVGIPGMRERLRLLGGRMDISSNGKGTTLTGMVPLQSGDL